MPSGNPEDSMQRADFLLAEYDKRFGKQRREYTHSDLPPFEALEDGAVIDGVTFYRHYDQSSGGNFCLKTKKGEFNGGPYYSNQRTERDFNKWWDTVSGEVVKQAIEDMDESSNIE
jgi:hypothetical protein